MYDWIFNKVLFPLYEEKIARRNTLRYIREYKGNLSLTRDQIIQKQLEKLKALLQHANSHCDFYKEQWSNIGFNPSDVQRVSDIECLPILDKNVIRDNYSKFVSDLHVGNNISKSTGGSTGQPFKFELDYESNERRQGVMWRVYGGLGAGPGVRVLSLWGGNTQPGTLFSDLKDKLYHSFYHRKMLNSFNLTKFNIGSYIRGINSYKPKAIVSYVNPLVTVAEYILENGISVWSPDTILTGAEPLYEFQRKIIQRAFNAPVYNTYGCREFMSIGAECEKQNGFHINIDHLIVEVVGENTSSKEPGEVIITDLHNYGFPLIRYKNGDLASLSENDLCSCGSPLPLIKSIDGRKLDIIKTPDGRIIPGEFFPHLLKDYSNIKQFQVIQNMLDSIQLKIVLYDPDSLNEVTQLSKQIGDQCGPSLKINVEIVETLQLTASGKLKVIINNLK